MSGHIHSALMAEYAKDAAETERPWDRWEVQTARNSSWYPLADHPEWKTFCAYRRKPRTININGHEVPEPCRDTSTIPYEAKYWMPELTHGARVTEPVKWTGNDVDREWLRRGLVHFSPAAAQAHANALLSFTEVSK